MHYTRLYTGKNGDSHFENVEINFKEVDFAPPAPPLDLSEFGPAEYCSIMKASKGWYGDWHPAPYRQLHFYLSGEVEVETSGGKIKQFGPGSITLVEDTTGKGHRSRVVGSSDVIIAIVKLVAQ